MQVNKFLTRDKVVDNNTGSAVTNLDVDLPSRCIRSGQCLLPKISDKYVIVCNDITYIDIVRDNNGIV